MTEVNFNTKIARQRDKHLSKEERETLNALLKQSYSYRKIAKYIGVSPQTVVNEVNRGTVRQKKKINGIISYFNIYDPTYAHERYKKSVYFVIVPLNSKQCAHFLLNLLKFLKNLSSPQMPSLVKLSVINPSSRMKWCVRLRSTSILT